MKSISTRKARSSRPALEPVRFEFAHLGASRVCVAGPFNGWDPAATPMLPSRDGRWLKELFLPPGTHEYCLVVDGKWMANSLAQQIVVK